jgi:hypothetical protein
MKVRDPYGETWRVTRRWLPWGPRRRGLGPDVWLDAADGPVSFLALLVIGILVLPLVTIGVFFVAEALLLLVLLPFVVLARVALGKQWWIEARRGFQPYWECEAGTWRESGARIRRVAEEITRGDLPLRTLGPLPDDSPDVHP